MQVTCGPPHDELHRSDAAQGVGKRRFVTGSHSRVRDRDEIAGKLLAVLSQEVGKIRATDLLFSLDQEDHIDRQNPLLAQCLGDPKDVGEDLALIVGGAPCVDPAIRDTGLEGMCRPPVERIGRLHVIVSVDQDGPLGGIAWRGGDNDRRTRRGVNRRR